jgi:hypothetical protein
LDISPVVEFLDQMVVLFLIFFSFFYYSFTHMYIHCLGHFSPSTPCLHPLHPPCFQAEPVMRFSPVPLKSRNKQ